MRNYISIILMLFGVFWVHSQNPKLKVITFNIRSVEPDFNIAPHAEFIKQEKPDLVGLQEVEVRTSRMQNRDLVLELAAATGMFAYFAPAYQKDDGEYGNAILSKFPITDSQYVELPIMKANGGSDQRVGLIAKLMLPNNFQLYFLNVHIDHRIHPDMAFEQLKPLVNHASINKNVSAVFTGDFNTYPTSPLLLEISKTLDNQTNNEGTFGADQGYIGSKLDYICSYPKGKWKLLETKVLYDIRISDHYPVMSVIEYQN